MFSRLLFSIIMPMARNYRLVLMLKSDIKKDGREKLLSEIKKMAGADKSKEESLGEKKLVYPIKSNKMAEYVLLKFNADNIPSDLDKNLHMKEDVIRHLLVRD